MYFSSFFFFLPLSSSSSSFFLSPDYLPSQTTHQNKSRTKKKTRNYKYSISSFLRSSLFFFTFFFFLFLSFLLLFSCLPAHFYTMPIDIISTAILDGPDAVPGWNIVKKYGPYVAVAAATKYYFSGSSNTWNRDMYGRVFIITGGTSGVGAQVAYDLAKKGAQIILLCRVNDSWTSEYVEDLREKTNNHMIYAETCDLASLHSVRLFATTFLDNQPPRRLDGVICCAAECLPRGTQRQLSVDGVERHMAVNYLANYHLLTLLKPAMHVQPPDRDFRVVLATCSSQALGTVDCDDLLWEDRQYPVSSPLRVFGTSKLMLGMFGRLLQRDLNDYSRSDKAPCNIKVSVVNPGLMRSPSTQRFISMGKLWGLLLYVVLYPIWFFFFKSTTQGAQSILFAVAAPILGAQDGGNLIQECKIVTKGRPELWDCALQDQVYQKTGELIEKLERQSAVERKKNEKKVKKDPAEVRRMEDMSVKPQTDEELDYKLHMMKKSLGVPMGTGSATVFSEPRGECERGEKGKEERGKEENGKASKKGRKGRK